MAELLKGAPVAEALIADASARAKKLRENGIVPTLAIVRVGERPADMAYERGATKKCAAAGVDVRSSALPEAVTQDELLEEIRALGTDNTVHGILLLRPLPSGLDEEAARCAIPAGKDVDGVTDGSLGGVFTGSHEGFSPCTAQAVMEIIRYYGIRLTGKRAAVLGRSLTVGRPLAMLMTGQGATVTLCHSKTEKTESITSEADIVVCAAGQRLSFGSSFFSPGQTVIDVGTHAHPETGKLCGDVRFDEVEPIVTAITPVPGGVGAVTSSVLASHVVQAAERQQSYYII